VLTTPHCLPDSSETANHRGGLSDSRIP